MKRKALILAVILALTIFLSACGGRVNMEAADKAPTAEFPMENSGLVGEPSSGKPDSDIYSNDSNKVIRTAKLTIQSTDFDAAVEALNQLTKEYGGWYETADVDGGSYYSKNAMRSGYYIVRVPKENFVAFRDGINGIGHVYSISENTQDVGAVYYDTEARLATLTTKRERLLALLEQATVMEDIISLENALAEVQYEIDAHTASLRKYDSLIGYSTFHINLDEVVELTDEPSIKESFGSRFAANLKEGFKNFGDGMESFAIWFARNLIGIVIFAAVVAAVILVIRRNIKRRRTKKAESE